MARYDFVNGEGNPVKQETKDKNLFEDSQLEIERKILNKVRRGLSFLEGWHLCPKCNAVFGLIEGEEGTCPICECSFYNQGGDLIFRGYPEEEESEEELEEESEEEKKGFESVIIRGGSFMNPTNDDVDVKKIGTVDCPCCKKSVDWDSIEPHYGFFGVVKKCPECGEQSYALNQEDEDFCWLRRNPDRDNEVGFFGGISFGEDEED